MNKFVQYGEEETNRQLLGIHFYLSNQLMLYLVAMS